MRTWGNFWGNYRSGVRGTKWRAGDVEHKSGNKPISETRKDR